MKRTSNKIKEQEMLEEYDFRGGVRGKYSANFSNGRNAIVPPVAEVCDESKDHKANNVKRSSRKSSADRDKKS